MWVNRHRGSIDRKTTAASFNPASMRSRSPLRPAARLSPATSQNPQDSQISETLTRCWLLKGAASMGVAVSITRRELTASELRKAASGEKNSAAARRILALALVLDGVDRKTAAETCGMDRQTL